MLVAYKFSPETSLSADYGGCGYEVRNATALGALAQLVERFHGMEEVMGSIPLGSTVRNG